MIYTKNTDKAKYRTKNNERGKARHNDFDLELKKFLWGKIGKKEWEKVIILY